MEEQPNQVLNLNITNRYIREMLSTIAHFLIDPVTIFLVLIGAGFLLRVRNSSSGYWKSCFWLAVIWFYIMTTPFVPNSMTYLLEKQYDPILVPVSGSFEEIQQARESFRGADIVILGAGHTQDPRLPAISSLVGNSLARLTEGIRLYRLIPGSRLVFAGFQDDWEGARSQAEVYAEAAMELGADLSDRSRYEMLPPASDTWEESGAYKRFRSMELENIRANKSDKKIILITNAIHMPRAIAGFRKRGFDPAASPAGYVIKKDGDEDTYLNFGFMDIVPSSDSAGRLRSALKEYAGHVELWFLKAGDSRES